MTTEQPERPRPTQRTPATDDFPSGPDVGVSFPDFRLPDQHGRPRTFSREHESRSLVVFFRSATW